MSYNIYHTKAFLVGFSPLGESDRFALFFTDKLGLIPALATGARTLHSKMRSHLTLFNFLEASFVRGKNGWRLVSAETLISPRGMSARKFFGRLAVLIRRLIHGEGEHNELFLSLEEILNLTAGGLREKDLENIYLYFLVKTLAELGYWDAGEGEIFLDGKCTSEALAGIGKERNRILILAKKALEESHL